MTDQLQPLNFQEIIMTLQRFWAEQGCLIWQPYYIQVGAGTFNPATFLRVLGPEPWNVAYVEPSIRPDDARYGDNPNRMQMHYQFQVILKPDPGNPQEIYLRSLEALGIDGRLHDIRFVEDNWESPALGAWGLGWEIWLDGQEITQYTYFQQAGGVVLDPVSVEITYGLDRIAIALQRVRGFQDIQWDETFTAGDVNLQAEQEHSKYYFEIADVERLRKMYDLFEAESRVALEHGLVLPAHDYLLKCSHTFNVLDTRGAIGVTDRQAFFARMRELARRVANLYLEQRQRLEYPFLPEGESQVEPAGRTVHEKRVQAAELKQIKEMHGSSPFLLEIGTEELPAGDLASAMDQLRSRLPGFFKELRLSHGEVKVSGTPRRIVVYVESLAESQAEGEQVVKGPPADRAFDSLGQPTKAAEGFARSRGMSVSDLQIREMDGGRYVVAVVRLKGRFVVEVLSEELPGLIGSIKFEKSMRWNRTNVPFSRPIRWLLSLYGEIEIPFEYGGIVSGNKTRGLRYVEPAEMTVLNPDAYFAALSNQGIVQDVDMRQSIIWEQVEKLAAEVSGRVEYDEVLLAEVANLVEAPHTLLGKFDPSFLDLPDEVLVSVMKKHQRYFPVETSPANHTREGLAVTQPTEGRVKEASRLLPYFITVRNGDGRGSDLVVEGNEHVILARFSDAAFFIQEDLKKPLEAYLPMLSTMVFQVDLGSMLDKAKRIRKLVSDLAHRISLDSRETRTAERAAELCKADLATRMVVEMTSLQGVMGRYYARMSGESDEVAAAIFEHYLPRHAGDVLPKTLPGLIVGLADRLDMLAGLFSVGLAPTGAKDPFAQRRAALGIVQNLVGWDLDFNLLDGLKAAASHLPQRDGAGSAEDGDWMSACLDFIVERLRHFFLEQGYRYDVVDAVLAAQGEIPARASRAVRELSEWVKRSDWRSILPAYARCVRITRDLQDRHPVSIERFVEPAERDLYGAYQVAAALERTPGSVDDFLEAFLPMIPAVNRFFDEVLVMEEDPTLRENRLGLLQSIVDLAEGVADMSRLEGF